MTIIEDAYQIELEQRMAELELPENQGEPLLWRDFLALATLTQRPKDVAELCLAFEVHRRLIEPKLIDSVDERGAGTRPRRYPARWRLATPASMRC
jgi:hypothetical protein